VAEVLTNGTFDSDLSSWSKWGGASTEMFVYDATGAAHDGGAAKAIDEAGIPYSTNRYSMYQSFSLTNAEDINAAVVDTWIQYNDAWPAANAEVSKSHVTFWVQLRDPDENWHTIKKAKYFYGSLTAVTLLTNEDVKSTIQTGGNGTWYFGVTCEIYRANLSTGWFVGWFDDLSLDITYYSYDEHTETITLTDTTTESKTLTQSDTETITLSDIGAAVLSADPTFRYYYGDYSGKVYAEDSAYKSDDGTAIDAYWDSKWTDFAEQGMDTLDKFKTLHKMKLRYEDISSSPAVVTISVKTDGGSWSTVTENVGGSGDDATKIQEFHMIKTGEVFKFRIENNSSDNEFKWVSLECLYVLGGDYFQS
jgi:hypothetical protein